MAEQLADNKPVAVEFLEDLRFRELRHEATTRLFELKLDIMEVAAITVHKSLPMYWRHTICGQKILQTSWDNLLPRARFLKQKFGPCCIQLFCNSVDVGFTSD